MRADMGSVNPVIAPQLPDLLEGRRNTLDTTLADARIARSKQFVRAEKNLEERVKKLNDRLTETRDLQRFSPGNVERCVRTALRLADWPDLEPVSLKGAPDGTTFRMPALSGSWQRCLEGLQHPFSGEVRPITFDHDVAKGRDDVVLVHLNHQLVQMSLRLLRAQIWARDDIKKLERVAVRSLPDNRLSEPVALVVSRLVVIGGNHHRLHEELTEAGGYLREHGFRREDRVSNVRTMLDDSRPTAISEDVALMVIERFDTNRDALLASVEARSKDRLSNLRNTIDTRRKREIADIQKVLDELERSLESELKKEKEPQQLSLFSEDERLQLTRDISALEARLARIPEERESETRVIDERHANVAEHTFPVAVLVILPESMTNGAVQ